MANAIDPKLTVTEAAEILGVRPQTMDLWRCLGKGPKFLKLGRAVRYRQSDLDAWLASRECSNTAEAMALA